MVFRELRNIQVLQKPAINDFIILVVKLYKQDKLSLFMSTSSI